VASLRRRHYDRATRELSLADCFLLAAASRLDASIATSDPGVASAAREESLELIALPDSTGRRP
jgi:predicted nucleic acid-binding protein